MRAKTLYTDESDADREVRHRYTHQTVHTTNEAYSICSQRPQPWGAPEQPSGHPGPRLDQTAGSPERQLGPVWTWLRPEAFENQNNKSTQT